MGTSASAHRGTKRNIDQQVSKHRSTIGNVYTPHLRIRTLSYIKHRPEDEKDLRCSSCNHVVKSSWFFEPPGRNASRRLLKPSNGHTRCRAQQKAGNFVPVDGTRSC